MGTTSDFHAWLSAMDPRNPTELYARFESVTHEEDFGGTWRIEAAKTRLRITGAHMADTLVLKRAHKQDFLDALESRCFCGLDFEDRYEYARNLRNPNSRPNAAPIPHTDTKPREIRRSFFQNYHTVSRARTSSNLTSLTRTGNIPESPTVFLLTPSLTQL